MPGAILRRPVGTGALSRPVSPLRGFALFGDATHR